MDGSYQRTIAEKRGVQMIKKQIQARTTVKWIKYALCGCTLIGTVFVSTPTLAANMSTIEKTWLVAQSVKIVSNTQSVQLLINGIPLKTAVKPDVKNGVGYVPLQTILNALGYPYQVKGNQVIVSNGSRVSILTANSQTIQINGKKVSVKGKVQKAGNTFIVSADTVSRVIGRGVSGYYANQNAISIRVPVYAHASQAIREKFSSSYQVKSISFQVPSEWEPYLKISAPHASALTEQELQITIDWVENGITTYLATVFIRDVYHLTTKQWKKWFTEGMEQKLREENGVMFSYISVGDPTEELLKPENEALFQKIADIVNNQLSDVMQTMDVTYRTK